MPGGQFDCCAFTGLSKQRDAITANAVSVLYIVEIKEKDRFKEFVSKGRIRTNYCSIISISMFNPSGKENCDFLAFRIALLFYHLYLNVQSFRYRNSHNKPQSPLINA